MESIPCNTLVSFSFLCKKRLPCLLDPSPSSFSVYVRLRLQWRRPSFDLSHDGEGPSPPPPSPSTSQDLRHPLRLAPILLSSPPPACSDVPTPSPHPTRDRLLLPTASPLSRRPSMIRAPPPPSDATMSVSYATSSRTSSSPGGLSPSPESPLSSRGTSRPSLIPAGGT